MECPDGWLARSQEHDWPPPLGRIDVRVDDTHLGETERLWLLSDAASELLDIRRDDDEKLSDAVALRGARIGWWNDAGGLAGVVLTVASWAAAGVVGNAIYDALKSLATQLRAERVDLPYAVIGRREAEVMARWVACAEFHGHPACECADTGLGRTVATGVWNEEADDYVTIPPFGFAIAVNEVKVLDGEWTVTLSETEDGNDEPSREYTIAGITGATFFVSARSRALGRSRFGR